VAREVVGHLRRHDLVLYAAIAIVPLLGITAFAAAPIPATSYGDGLVRALDRALSPRPIRAAASPPDGLDD
jgi:hypothetical protein